MKILVTGGAGYIGSHTIVDLIESGFEVVSIDNFSRSNGQAFDGIEKITRKRIQNYNIDLTDKSALLHTIEQIGKIDGIIHFAAYKAVGESVDQPLMYYQNNLISLLNLLEVTDRYEIPYFIFSSSCSVYGDADELPVSETTPLQDAQSPYGSTKQMSERIITDVAQAGQDTDYVLLRYFNPVGAHPSAEIGEYPIDRPNNLVPVITQTAIGKIDKMYVWGADYDTRDGSAIRDYIHVVDIAHAHTLALQYIIDSRNPSSLEILNLGTGEGVSVLEAISAFEKVAQQKLNYEIGPRREGDVVAVYADNRKAQKELGWVPQYALEDMMSTAWEWEKNLQKKTNTSENN